MESPAYMFVLALASPFLAIACCGVLTAVVVFLFFALRDPNAPGVRKRE